MITLKYKIIPNVFTFKQPMLNVPTYTKMQIFLPEKTAEAQVRYMVDVMDCGFRTLLAHFYKPYPEWHFYVSHELAEDKVQSAAQANDNFKLCCSHHHLLRNILVNVRLFKFELLAPAI